jgi:glutaconate CoA-transferase subunit B
VFTFDGSRFTLASLHPGETRESIREHTGFDYIEPVEIPRTAPPTAAERALLRGAVCGEMLETYPAFCRRIWNRDAAGSAA